MKVQLFAPSNSNEKDHGAGSSRLINFYLVPGDEPTLRNFPGLTPWATGAGVLTRAFCAANGVAYLAASGNINAIQPGGAVSTFATIPDDAETTLFGARGSVCATADGKYFVISAAGDVTQPGSGRIQNIGSACFCNDFVLLAERGGREIEWTRVGIPTERNALNYATASAQDDLIVRIVALGSYVWVLKERTTEIWATAQASNGDIVWRRIPGAVRAYGLKAFGLVTLGPDSLFFIGSDGVAYFGGGIEASRVSNPAVERRIADARPTHCLYFEDLGHRFFVIRYEDAPADVYDAATGVWCERATGTALEPWRIAFAAQVGTQWRLAGVTARTFGLQRTPIDDGKPMLRRAVSQTIEQDAPFIVSRLNIRGSYGALGVDEPMPPFVLDEDGTPMLDEAGRPLTAEDGVSAGVWRRGPKIMLAVSRDGGRTFGLTKYRDLGWPGDYERLATWRAMGQGRRFTVSLGIADPVEVSFRAEAFLE